MTASDRAERLLGLVGDALEQAPQERGSFLDRACGEDPILRAEAESLLAQEEGLGGFIDTTPGALAAEALAAAENGALQGKRIGAYRLRRKIAQGGMGSVYLAERADRAYEKQVAIKLITFAFDAEEVRRRFRTERQILASLDHPNIARLLDAGATEEGLPYFVIEFVEGLPVDQYCHSRSLNIAARLELFRTICAAVHYAHQHLIVHRDLKPGNILISEEGVVKLLDFGIAKLLAPDPTLRVLRTITEMRALTPEYASPEQVRGETVTTASDIYSLGVLLYELLTGKRPYRLKAGSPEELVRAITEQEPARPSTVLARGGRERAHGRLCHALNPKAVGRDLDNIVLMAMRKDPNRRYTSAAQMADDIRRYLGGRPVIARKDTIAYRTTKFVRRNRVGVAAASVVFATLVAGIIATTSAARQARSQTRIAAVQRDYARQQTAKADRVIAFLQNVLGFSDPSWASSNPNRNREATVAEALGEAGRRAEQELANEPEALAAVHFTIGNTYRTQSKLPEAEPHLRASLDLRRRVLGAHNSETGQSMVAMAEWYVVSGRYAEAEPLYHEAIDVFAQAQDAKWLAIALNDLGTVKSSNGDAPAAEQALRRALDVSANFEGPERAPRAIMYNTLGLARRDQGDLLEGAMFLEKAIAEHNALPGEPRSELALAMNNLANIRVLQGDLDRAESLARDAFALFLKTLGENHQYTAYPVMLLAEIDYRRAAYGTAREKIEQAIRIQQRVLPLEHPDLARSQVTLGKILMQTGELGLAESATRAALEKLSRSLAPGHQSIATAQGALGECLVLQKRYDEAEPFLRQSHDAFQSRVGLKDPRTQSARQRLLRLYQEWRKPKEAAPYR